jgi:2-polyprenyl-3-methyl-5-hydroxy-6-metoxy-1,4-benzoquinol methylase
MLNWRLEDYRELFVKKQVLDLACHNGKSSFRIKKCGASSVHGVDIRSNLINENTNKRMVIRLYNAKKINYKTPLHIDEIWEWNDNNLKQGIM